MQLIYPFNPSYPLWLPTIIKGPLFACPQLYKKGHLPRSISFTFSCKVHTCLVDPPIIEKRAPGSNLVVAEPAAMFYGAETVKAGAGPPGADPVP